MTEQLSPQDKLLANLFDYPKFHRKLVAFMLRNASDEDPEGFSQRAWIVRTWYNLAITIDSWGERRAYKHYAKRKAPELKVKRRARDF